MELYISLLVAMSVTFIVDYSGVYERFIKFIGLDFKPFNCSLCVTFWSSVILVICSMITDPNFYMVVVPFVSSLMQIVIGRLMKALPLIY